MRKIKEFKNNGGSIVFVSHDMNAVKIPCDRALLLEQDSKIEEGEPDKIINPYNFLPAKKGKGEAIRLCVSKSFDVVKENKFRFIGFSRLKAQIQFEIN